MFGMEKWTAVDWASFLVAVIGMVLSYQSMIMGQLTPEQTGVASLFFLGLSQIGSFLNTAYLKKQQISEEESAA